MANQWELVVCVDCVAVVPVGRSVRSESGEGWMWWCSVECCSLTAIGKVMAGDGERRERL